MKNNGSLFFLKIKVNRKYQKNASNQQPHLHKSRDLGENNQGLVDDKVFLFGPLPREDSHWS